jgi:hypothetical protein
VERLLRRIELVPDEPASRSSCLTSFGQLFRSQERYELNDVMREPLRNEGKGGEGGRGEGKRGGWK